MARDLLSPGGRSVVTPEPLSRKISPANPSRYPSAREAQIPYPGFHPHNPPRPFRSRIQAFNFPYTLQNTQALEIRMIHNSLPVFPC